MKLLSIAIILLVSSSCLSGASANKNKKKRQIAHGSRHMQLRPSKHNIRRRTRDSSVPPETGTETETEEDFEEKLPSLWDEDLNDPPGPDEGWPHTEPFHLDTEMFAWEIIDEMNMPADADEDANKNNLPTVQTTQIARPEGSETAYYTGVTHIRHVNNPTLVTLFFSAGRHDGGSNTYLTVGTPSNHGANPFVGAQEQYIDHKDVSTYTWASSFTFKEETADGLKVLHYALFSGGSGGGKIGASKMYAFKEDENGQLMHPELVWDEGRPKQPARSCLLADLGAIYEGDVLVSKAGLPDIIISELGGIHIYSKIGENWKLIRSLPLQNEASSDNPAGTSSYAGLALVTNQHLFAISARSNWKQVLKTEPDSPCVLYDYLNDDVVETFSANAQTVSVDVLHNGTQVLLGSGGQAHYSPQPNLLFDMAEDDVSMIKSDAQIVKDTTTSYGKNQDCRLDSDKSQRLLCSVGIWTNKD